MAQVHRGNKRTRNDWDREGWRQPRKQPKGAVSVSSHQGMANRNTNSSRWERSLADAWLVRL